MNILCPSCHSSIPVSETDPLLRCESCGLTTDLSSIGTYPGGATTLVEDGVEGFIVPPRDPSRLAEAMIRLGRDRELNARMGEAAYRKGAVKNSWQDYGDRLLEEYTVRLQKKGKAVDEALAGR